MEIKNYIKVSEYIHTSGQPKKGQFGHIADLGVKTVVNLAMPDSDNAIADEGKIVASNKMNYIHIPVVWEAPEVYQFNLFRAILNLHKTEKIWVHCALNWRVSSFIYLYKIVELGESESEAYSHLTVVWKPNKVWSAFFKKIA